MEQQQQHFVLGEPSRFFELEAAVQQLRPLVIQVLKTQMYHNSTAAVDLRRGIRRVREVCKQVRAETVLLSKQRKGAGEQNNPVYDAAAAAAAAAYVPGNADAAAAAARYGDQPQSKRQKPDQSSSVVGGSPSGMNFVIVQPGDDQKVPVASTAL